MSFTVAIVGRPNVGKSTLFNRLVGRRLALVDNAPGVTRDRREGQGRLGDLEFTIVDTAGLENAAPDSLSGRMRAQTEAAIGAADVILFVVDARAGVTPADRSFADLVRRSGRPIVLIANKCEGRGGESGRLEAFALGLGEPIAISAEHAEGMGDLYHAVREAAPASALPSDDDGDDDAAGEDVGTDERPADQPVRVAVVGRPNSGKSTLINHLIGEDRLLTGPEAGITRDAIAVDIEWQGRKFNVYDTAGLRRRSRVEEKLEKLSVADTLNAIRFAEVVVVLVDGERPFDEQDQRIVDLVEREGRALVVAFSKWDLVEERAGAIGRMRGEVEKKITQIKGVSLVAVSGLSGEGIDLLMQAILDAFAVWNKRVSTNALNRWFDSALSAHPPPAVSGRRLSLNYITQPKSRPPTFVIFCTRADAVPDSYKRYLINGLRTAFELPGTPIRLNLREKRNPFAGRAARK